MWKAPYCTALSYKSTFRAGASLRDVPPILRCGPTKNIPFNEHPPLSLPHFFSSTPFTVSPLWGPGWGLRRWSSWAPPPPRRMVPGWSVLALSTLNSNYYKTQYRTVSSAGTNALHALKILQFCEVLDRVDNGCDVVWSTCSPIHYTNNNLLTTCYDIWLFNTSGTQYTAITTDVHNVHSLSHLHTGRDGEKLKSFCSNSVQVLQ